MKSLKWVLPAVAIATVVACGGGGGDAGTSPFTSTTACAATAASAASSACVTASSLTLQLSSSSILNSGATVTATATATTSSGQAVSGIPILFSVDNDATFTQTSAVTGSTGQAVAVISIGANPSNRVITVKATSGQLTSSAPFAVTGSMLTATGSAIVAPGSAANEVIFRLTNSNGAGIPNQAISVVAGSATPTTGTTDSNGNYTYIYTAPATAGSINVVGSSGGVDKTLTVLVQTGAGSIAPAIPPISSASLSANPSVVSTNTAGSTTNRTEIRALFVGPSNATLARVRVRFDLAGDQNNIGGTFSTGANVIYSDANGIATTAYIPGLKASPTNGVTIRACYDITDFAVGTCPNQATTTVTVASDPLSVTIGSNSVILVPPANLTYRRQFVVLVVDASGRAKANVDIVPSLDLPIYFKGQYVRGATWLKGEIVNGAIVADPGAACNNEDLNRNGVLEGSEDINLSGAIEPRKSDATITILGTGKTDENGSAIVQVEYPQNVASWLQIKILVSATGVSGTEGRATWTEVLPVPADTITATATPPYVVSPYGIAIHDEQLGTPPAGPFVPPCRNKN